MAIATAELAIHRVNQQNTDIEWPAEVRPWDELRRSTPITDKVLTRVAGLSYAYQEALLCPAKNEGVTPWRRETRINLVKYLQQVPASREIYESLYRGGMINPVDIRDLHIKRYTRNKIPKGGV